MRKEAEINYFRANILNKYIDELEEQHKKEKLKKEILAYYRELQRKRKEKQQKKLASGEYKKCKKCGKVLELENFYKNNLKSHGVFDECKDCVKERTRLRRERLKLSTGFAI